MYCFIEVDRGENKNRFSSRNDIILLSNKSFNIYEDYELYFSLGGPDVFSSAMLRKLNVGSAKRFGRGLPKMVSSRIIYEYSAYVVDREDVAIFKRLNPGNLCETRSVSHEEAAKMVCEGSAVFMEYKETLYNPNHRTTLTVPFVSFPGIAGANWLYHDEILENLEHCGLSLDLLRENTSQMFPHLVDLMKTIESNGGERSTRMVVFFDKIA